MKNLIPTLLCDFYKVGHREQYPTGTEVVYSTWTPRSNKHFPAAKSAVNFGIQAFVQEFVIDFFDENFFGRPKAEVVNEYARYLKHTLFIPNPKTQHIEDLHDLGYMPLEIRALKEGLRVPFRVPMMTMHNTDPRFFWVTNYLESLASCELWKASTTATIAAEYRSILNNAALETTGNIEGVEFQGHDFSFRGQSGVYDAATSSMGHLLSFVGTDTIPAIMGLEQYYNADIEKELVGCSVPATEHSVMCAGGKATERDTYERLITQTYPTGIISIVSDTWDLWNTLVNIIPSLKSEILARDGGEGSIDKVVIRPDSGDPVLIMTGDPAADPESPEGKGVIQLLWDTFGGTVNPLGYKVLNPKIGAIYGDSITLDLCQRMCDNLKKNGFASTNMVYGIGSYTYQHNTRDTLGYAMKSTLTVQNGKEVAIFKDPATDDGIKKSAKGGVAVVADAIGRLTLQDGHGIIQQKECQMDVVFKDGKVLRNDSLAAIRKRLANG